MPPLPVIQWLKQHYPRPSVDPEWLDACCGWISDEKNLSHATNFDEYIKEVETQLLRSSLTDSMVAGTGLPPNTSEMANGKISGKPVLVELTSITEIAHSAFSLQNTRQTMIDRADLAGLAEEDEDEEGRAIKYPRGMLHLTLSDGVTKVKAIEYRSLADLELGVTPLGYKVQCLICYASQK
ncbi:hypothetical protein SERLA73DRAFT_53999 [Serpula lacrymans var. lacrymans S7.3]|uniref:RecQ-mediated genome instability protein 1 n=1 Tax=Serpula lacrymans var. lacrymans (strain S7.3) TaxID=936435 RepID=F8PYC6_SERL3|nr:hypothetical protein SERLA73DRAFT_53999 [Serpula lacrymans var. lacrymans S7.3]